MVIELLKVFLEVIMITWIVECVLICTYFIKCIIEGRGM